MSLTEERSLRILRAYIRNVSLLVLLGLFMIGGFGFLVIRGLLTSEEPQNTKVLAGATLFGLGLFIFSVLIALLLKIIGIITVSRKLKDNLKVLNVSALAEADRVVPDKWDRFLPLSYVLVDLYKGGQDRRALAKREDYLRFMALGEGKE